MPMHNFGCFLLLPSRFGVLRKMLAYPSAHLQGLWGVCFLPVRSFLPLTSVFFFLRTEPSRPSAMSHTNRGLGARAAMSKEEI